MVSFPHDWKRKAENSVNTITGRKCFMLSKRVYEEFCWN